MSDHGHHGVRHPSRASVAGHLRTACRATAALVTIGVLGSCSMFGRKDESQWKLFCAMTVEGPSTVLEAELSGGGGETIFIDRYLLARSEDEFPGEVRSDLLALREIVLDARRGALEPDPALTRARPHLDSVDAHEGWNGTCGELRSSFLRMAGPTGSPGRAPP